MPMLEKEWISSEKVAEAAGDFLGATGHFSGPGSLKA